MSHNLPRFPAEVCEKILDYLAELSTEAKQHYPGYDDPWTGTLHACSLVCRAWTYRSQLYLFSALRVQCTRNSGYGLDHLIAFLGREQYVTPRVAELTAVGDDVDATPTLHTVPLRLPKHLPRLTRLHISNGVLYIPPAVFLALHHFPPIVQLTLAGFAVCSFSDLRKFISAFANLKDLRITFPTSRFPHAVESSHNIARAYPTCKARLDELHIVARSAWLIDARSLSWLLWLNKSSIASHLTWLDLGRMMILDKAMLAAVDTLIIAANERLNLGIGPGIELINSMCFSSMVTERND